MTRAPNSRANWFRWCLGAPNSSGLLWPWVALVVCAAHVAAPFARAEEAGSLDRKGVQATIAEARRITAAGGVEESYAVTLGGVPQWVSVRGNSRDNPILLFIHGGPASTELPVSWLYQKPWEEFFTVVQWDQRAAGKSVGLSDLEAVGSTISVERMVADGIELVDHLRGRFGKQKIFVLGHSWGTIIGLEIARRHPEWLYGYIAMGQAIYARDNERLGYAFAVNAALKAENEQALEELRSIAPYPPTDGGPSVSQILTQRKWVTHYGGLTWGRGDLAYDHGVRLLSPDYSDQDLEAGKTAGVTLMALLPELGNLDLRDVIRLDCPIVVFAGEHDYATPTEVAKAWFDRLEAPSKRFIFFPEVAHMLQYEVPGKLLLHLVRDVLPLAEPAEK